MTSSTDYSDVSILELAAMISKHLQASNIQAVLVGGLAVEIYTENLYLTKDINLVNIGYDKPQVLRQAMAEIGFRKSGRVFVNETTPISVEFPSAPLSIGDRLISDTTTAQIGEVSIPILKVTDVVMDRLSAFVHWHDKQSLVQAVAICLKHKLSPAGFDEFFEYEASNDHKQLFTRFLGLALKRGICSMDDLEDCLLELLGDID